MMLRPDSSKTALIAVFTKIPGYGIPVKTRLAEGGSLSESHAEILAGAFLSDTISAVVRSAEAAALISDPPLKNSDLEKLLEGLGIESNRCTIHLHAQQNLPFGERLQTAIEHLFDDYARPLVVVGTDTPTISPSLLNQASHIVESGKYAVGPTSGGGFYLLGLPLSAMRSKIDISSLFADPGRSELECLCSAITDSKADYELLAPQFDIDTEQDLASLLSLFQALKQQSLPADSDGCLSGFPAASAAAVERLGITTQHSCENNRLITLKPKR